MSGGATARVWRHPDFRWFYAGHTVSVLGDGMTPLAVSFAVLAETGSLADVGYVQAARFAPLVALVLVGGVFADRTERRQVMIAADVARALSQGGFAALVITHHAALWALVALLVSGAGSAFYAPAAIALLQDMLPRDPYWPRTPSVRSQNRSER